jgi:hypothetical protein
MTTPTKPAPVRARRTSRTDRAAELNAAGLKSVPAAVPAPAPAPKTPARKPAASKTPAASKPAAKSAPAKPAPAKTVKTPAGPTPSQLNQVTAAVLSWLAGEAVKTEDAASKTLRAFARETGISVDGLTPDALRDGLNKFVSYTGNTAADPKTGGQYWSANLPKREHPGGRGLGKTK